MNAHGGGNIVCKKDDKTLLGHKFMTANEMRRQAFRKQFGKKKTVSSLKPYNLGE
jgi:hypothetical protein